MIQKENRGCVGTAIIQHFQLNDDNNNENFRNAIGSFRSAEYSILISPTKNWNLKQSYFVVVVVVETNKNSVETIFVFGRYSVKSIRSKTEKNNHLIGNFSIAQMTANTLNERFFGPSNRFDINFSLFFCSIFYQNRLPSTICYGNSYAIMPWTPSMYNIRGYTNIW